MREVWILHIFDRGLYYAYNRTQIYYSRQQSTILYFWCQWQQRGTDLKLSKLCHRSLLMAPFCSYIATKKGKLSFSSVFFSFIYQIFSLQLLPINYNYLQLLEITYKYKKNICNYQTTDKKKTFLLPYWEEKRANLSGKILKLWFQKTFDMQLSKNACPMRGAFHAKKVSQRLFVGESLLNKPQLIILFSSNS